MTREEARQRAEDDFWFLCTEVLQYRRWYTPLHRPLARAFQNASRKSLILIPRDHLKTTLITQCGSTWLKLCDPNCRIFISSAKLDNSLLIGDQIRRHFQDENRLTFLAPELRMPPGRHKDAGRRFEWSLPCRTEWGAKETCFHIGAVDASATSRHYNYIFFDDIVSDRNVKTPEAIQLVKDHYRNCHPLLEPDGKMYIVGTRWDETDLYGEIKPQLEKEGAFVLTKRVRMRNPATRKMEPIYPRTDDGEIRYTDGIIRQLRHDMGAYLFSCQYENDPIPNVAVRLVTDDQIIYADLTPPDLPHFLAIDPAISLRETADNTAIVTIATDHNRNFYVVDVVRDKLRPSEVAETVWKLWEQYDIQGGWCEANALQETYREYIERLCNEYGGNIQLQPVLRPSTEGKVARILSLQGKFEQNRIVFVRDARGIDEAVRELRTWSKRKAKTATDDVVSALVDVVRNAWFPAPKAANVPTHQVVLDHFAAEAAKRREYDDPMNVVAAKVVF